MSKPALVKLGGSILTDKSRERVFRRAVAKRLLAEVAKSGVPAVVLHGAGGYGHPPAARHRLGRQRVGAEARAGVSETLAGVQLLMAEVTAVAVGAGLRPIPVPVHLHCTSEGDALLGLPVQRIVTLLEEGYTPILAGTLVRDADLGWRVVSADELLEVLASEMDPRLAVYATDVDGVFSADPSLDPDARLLARVGPDELARMEGSAEATVAGGSRADVTERMLGKVRRAMAVADVCPTLIINGTVRGRLLDALKGKSVKGTRVG